MQLLSEEIWVRRDLPNPGRPFILREYLLVDTLRSLTFLVIPITIFIQIGLSHLGFRSFQSSRILALGYTMAICAPFVLATFFIFAKTIKTSSKCPLWLYAEQLNPEQLKIYHFRKPPTIIKLAESTLDTKTKFKHYTTITITDKDTNTSATLGLLTPEEYDRFMQYWNAANPQGTEAS